MAPYLTIRKCEVRIAKERTPSSVGSSARVDARSSSSGHPESVGRRFPVWRIRCDLDDLTRRLRYLGQAGTARSVSPPRVVEFLGFAEGRLTSQKRQAARSGFDCGVGNGVWRHHRKHSSQLRSSSGFDDPSETEYEDRSNEQGRRQ